MLPIPANLSDLERGRVRILQSSYRHLDPETREKLYREGAMSMLQAPPVRSILSEGVRRGVPTFTGATIAAALWSSPLQREITKFWPNAMASLNDTVERAVQLSQHVGVPDPYMNKPPFPGVAPKDVITMNRDAYNGVLRNNLAEFGKRHGMPDVMEQLEHARGSRPAGRTGDLHMKDIESAMKGKSPAESLHELERLAKGQIKTMGRLRKAHSLLDRTTIRKAAKYIGPASLLLGIGKALKARGAYKGDIELSREQLRERIQRQDIARDLSGTKFPVFAHIRQALRHIA